MDSLLREQEALSKRADLSAIIQEVDSTIYLLEDARQAITCDSPTTTLARLQNPIKQSFDGMTRGLKEAHKGLGDYSKALDKRFKDKTLPSPDEPSPFSQDALVDRAIGMHFLREGQFSVASAFLDESAASTDLVDGQRSSEPTIHSREIHSEVLQKQFAEMYYVLDEMRSKKNLMPATTWARANSARLEARGSNLEFELGRLQFIWLFLSGHHSLANVGLAERQQAALAFARDQFGPFQERYLKEIQRLVGAMAFCPNLEQSPYRQIFYSEGVWEELAMTFTREFCSLLGLSADSPLYIATTAGAIALPTLQKLRVIMEKKRTEWTTQNELPVEIPLPPSYRFHSIFVCPVSKEQTTDQNPPMMMPCGHVIALESLQRLSKVSRFKCPYCPGESHSKDAKKVFL